MQAKPNNKILYTLIAVLLCSCLLFCLLGNGCFSSACLVLAGLLCVLACSMLYMLAALRRSLSITLYSYKNIGLIAGVLFLSVFFTVMLSYFIAELHSAATTVGDIVRNIIAFPRKFSYFAVFAMVAVSILLGISNIALIRHEGFCLSNALSLLIAGLYIGGTFLIYFISDVLMEKVFVPAGLITDQLFLTLQTTIPLFFLLMLCYFECVLAGSAIMGWLAARQKPAFNKDYIIILGCSIDKRGGLLPLLKGRVNRAIRFAWEQEIETGKSLHYVPSGGQGANEIMSEGSAMELYLKTRGAEDYEVFPERKSVNTYENFLLSKAVIDEMKPDAEIAFATTNYHMLRSGILARKVGIDAEGIAGDTKWYFWPNGFVREFFGILSLEVKTHILVAVAAAVFCASIGCLCWFGII